MAEIRVVAVACPYGSRSAVYAYYVDAPIPVLIDAGVTNSPRGAIIPALRRLGIGLKDVAYVLATHGHWDHVGGAREVKDITQGKARVGIHPADEALLLDRARHMQTYWGERSRMLDDGEVRARDEALLYANFSEGLEADRRLADGDRVPIGRGSHLEVVHTPGHTPGSVTYILRQRASTIAFTGDSVQVGGSWGGSRFPLYSDGPQYRASLSRISEDVRPTHLYLAHRFLDRLGGAPLSAQLAGDEVRAALSTSLDVEHRIAVAVAACSDAGGAASDLAEMIEVVNALDLEQKGPGSWSAAVFVTLGAYRPTVSARGDWRRGPAS